jgi:hypothetical protein
MNQHLSRYDSMVSSESEVDIGEFDHDDILESKLSGLHHRKKTRRELFQDMLDELESAEINKFLGMASFATACAAVIFGVCSPLEHIEITYRMFVALAALFLLNNSFFIVKSVREQEIQPYKGHSGRASPDYHFIQGSMGGKTSFHGFLLYASFPFAIGSFAYGLQQMDAHLCTKMYLAQSVLYMWSSSLNFAMMLRDKFESKVWEGELEGRHIGSKKVELACGNVMNTLRYHQRQFQFIFFMIMVFAILMIVFVLVHWLSEKDKDKGIGLFTAAMFMCMMSSWNLSRVLQADRKIVELSVAAMFVIAIVLSVVGLCVVEFNLEHKMLLALSLVIIVDATFNFSKVQHRMKSVNKLTKVVQRKFHMEIGDGPYTGPKDDHGDAGGHGAKGPSARNVSTAMSKPAGGAGKKSGGH